MAQTEEEMIAADLGLLGGAGAVVELHMDQGAPKMKPPDVYEDQSGTWVISGPLGSSKYRGRRFETWQEAEKDAQEKFNVLAFWVYANRWHARVRGTKPGYTTAVAQ